MDYEKVQSAHDSIDVLTCSNSLIKTELFSLFPVCSVGLEEDECISDFHSSLLGSLFSAVEFSGQSHSFSLIDVSFL